jgi:hypothetical protein
MTLPCNLGLVLLPLLRIPIESAALGRSIAIAWIQRRTLVPLAENSYWSYKLGDVGKLAGLRKGGVVLSDDVAAYDTPKGARPATTSGRAPSS